MFVAETPVSPSHHVSTLPRAKRGSVVPFGQDLDALGLLPKKSSRSGAAGSNMDFVAVIRFKINCQLHLELLWPKFF